LALPHARVSGLSKLQAAIGICPDGVLDSKADYGPVRVYVLFVGNADNMTQHLGFLARVSGLFQQDGFLEHLVRSGSPARAMDVLRKAD
jgi:mannitol/fructose-specific phosphotransferase system IIA component (Ntr-type)